MPELHPLAAFILGLILGVFGTLTVVIFALIKGEIRACQYGELDDHNESLRELREEDPNGS